MGEIELRPSGTGEGRVAGVECARAEGCRRSCFYSVKNVRRSMFLECGFGSIWFKDRRLWRTPATVVDGSEGTWWVDGGFAVSSLQQRLNGQQDSDGVAVWYVEEVGEGGLA